MKSGHSRTALAALKALAAAGSQEINALLEIIESRASTYTAKQQALKDLTF